MRPSPNCPGNRTSTDHPSRGRSCGTASPSSIAAVTGATCPKARTSTHPRRSPRTRRSGCGGPGIRWRRGIYTGLVSHDLRRWSPRVIVRGMGRGTGGGSRPAFREVCGARGGVEVLVARPDLARGPLRDRHAPSGMGLAQVTTVPLGCAAGLVVAARTAPCLGKQCPGRHRPGKQCPGKRRPARVTPGFPVTG